MASRPPTSSRPLTSSLSGNTGGMRGRCKESSLSRPSTTCHISRDENARPSSPVGVTLAEELSRVGASRDDKKLSSVEEFERSDDVLVIEGMFSEEDITEINIVFEDVPVEISDLCTTVSPIPIDIEESDVRSDDAPVSSGRDGSYGKRVKFPSAAEPRPWIDDDHRPAKGPHTLRERRMSYLRAMHALSSQPEPKLPRAVLGTRGSVPEGTGWKIEAGVVGAWHRSSTHKTPEFLVKYGASPVAFLNAQREVIAAEVLRKKGGKSLGLFGLPQIIEARGPQQYQEAQTREKELDVQRQREEDKCARERQRQEIEDYLRSADIAAADLDERNLRDVVDAVLSAAAEVARFGA